MLLLGRFKQGRAAELDERSFCFIVPTFTLVIANGEHIGVDIVVLNAESLCVVGSRWLYESGEVSGAVDGGQGDFKNASLVSRKRAEITAALPVEKEPFNIGGRGDEGMKINPRQG